MMRLAYALGVALSLVVAQTGSGQAESARRIANENAGKAAGVDDGTSSAYKLFAKCDRAAMGQFTLRAQIIVPDTPLHIQTFAETEKLLNDTVVTGKHGVFAVERSLNPKTPPPKFISGLKKWNYDNQGRMRVDREEQRVLLQEPGFRGVFRTWKVHTVTPEDQVEFQAKSQGKILLYTPKGKYDSDETYLPILTSGRGYADLVERFTEVKEVEDGLLYCRGPGRWATGRPCDWELWIDPEASWLVRRVLCSIRESGNNIQKHIRNSGSQQFDGVTIPKNGLFFSGPAGLEPKEESNLEWWRVAYQTYENAANDELIEKARNLTQGDYPRGASVMDFRKGVPPVTYTVR